MGRETISGIRWMLSIGVTLLLSILLVLPAAAAAQQNHPVWYDRHGNAVDRDKAVKTVRSADIVLLGEVHDSKDIHSRQVRLLESFGHDKVVLALEQLDLEYGDALAALDARRDVSAVSLSNAGGFDVAGWGWGNYGALFELAAERRWPVRPINLSREKAREVARGKHWRLMLDEHQVDTIESLSPQLRLPAMKQRDLIEDLKAVHCGDMRDDLARRIARAQVARDILMADAVNRWWKAFPDHQVVAVMGTQHARRDRGAGYWLQKLQAKVGEEAVVVSVGMLPLAPDRSSELQGMASERFDWRVPTEPVDRPDMCGDDDTSSRNPT